MDGRRHQNILCEGFFNLFSKKTRMTLTKKVITILFGTYTILVEKVEAYYCEWSLCEPDLYCCGNNQCCSNVYSPWYFWAGAVVVALLLWSCSGMFRYCIANRKQGLIKYQDLESANLQLEKSGSCLPP